MEVFRPDVLFNGVTLFALRVLVSTVEWLQWMHSRFWIMGKLSKRSPFSVLSRLSLTTDCFAMACVRERYSLTFVEPSVRIDEREREFASAVLLGWQRILLYLLGRFRPTAFTYVHATSIYLSLRTRLIDDLFVKLVQKAGVKQVIILGAGYDFRAYRFCEERLNAKGGPVRVIEVDQSAVQQEKLRKLRAGLSKARFARVSQEVTYVACNFENNGELERKIRLCGALRSDVPTFYIWEGVVPYLSGDAVRQTLSALQLLSAPEITHVLFDTIGVDLRENVSLNLYEQLLLRGFKARGLQLFNSLPVKQEDCAALLRAYGFVIVNRWDIPSMAQLYGYGESMRGCQAFDLMGMNILHVKSCPKGEAGLK